MNRYKLSLLLLTIAFVFFARLWKIGSLPPLNRDEAAIGYNAYSLLKTKKDEWGKFLPLSFKSFGDYKMPGYIYATVLPVKVFGLTVFSTRLWSVVSGLAAIVSFYFLSLWVFKRLAITKGKERPAALLAALVLALNPWHFYFSRVAFEANLNLTFFLIGLTTLFYGFSKKWLLPLSGLSFGLMFYAYSSSFIFLPLFLILTVIIFRKDLLKNGSKPAKLNIYILISLVVFSALTFHATWSVWQVSKAKTNITIFSDPSILDNFNKTRFQAFSRSPLWAKLWLNKPFFYFRILAKKYLLSFSPNFLILKAGGHPWHQIPKMGLFYWADLFFFLLGSLSLIFLKKKRIKWSVLGWILLSPLPSAITVDAPHATRMLQIVPAIVVVMVIGFFRMWGWLNKKKPGVKKTVLFLLTAFYIFQVSRYFYLYTIDYPKSLPQALMPGIDKAISWIDKQNDKSRLVVFSNPLDFPYIYVAFYNRLDPDFFQKNAIWKPAGPAGLTAVEKIGRYRFWEGVPETNQKAFYVLQGETKAPTGFLLKHQIKNANQARWSIYAN